MRNCDTKVLCSLVTETLIFTKFGLYCLYNLMGKRRTRKGQRRRKKSGGREREGGVGQRGRGVRERKRLNLFFVFKWELSLNATFEINRR